MIVLEIGCSDGFTHIVQQQVKHLVVSDHDPLFIKDIKENPTKWQLDSFVYNPLTDIHNENYNGIYLLDVFEHIDPSQASLFIKNITNLLSINGTLIVGAPSMASQLYASKFKTGPHKLHERN